MTMAGNPMMVGGRYELEDLLGRGGMAEVRRAVDTRLGRPVAVKQLRADLATDPTFQARFRREAQSAAGLNHPNIVAVYDTGEETDPQTGVAIPYIVMELVEGPTLSDLLARGPLGEERTAAIGDQVLAALESAHAVGLVHRDVKPGNIMLTSTGTAKVMDFGIARSADAETLTGSGTVVGSASYLSPEQVQGRGVDHRSDLYSLGCVLYEALTGRPPFTGSSAVSVAHQHVSSAPMPPSRLAPVPPAMEAVLMRALAKDPGARHRSAAEMRAALAGSRVESTGPTGQTAPVRPAEPTRPLPAADPAPAGGWARLVATAALLALVAFAVAFALVRLAG
jgi:eukaryotic-like serine/threonine-protein kinase